MRTSVRRWATACTCALALALPLATVQAARMMDIEVAQLLRSAEFLRESLALTPNQQTLWQQTASKSGAILRERLSRRERAQAEVKKRLADPRQELRDLASGLEQEALTSAAEDKALRELWLTMADALTDAQRLQATQFLITQLDRVDHPDGPPRGERPERGDKGEHGQRPGGGMRRQGEGGGTRF